MSPPVADAPGAMTMSYVGLIEKLAPAMKFITPPFTGVPLKVVGTVSMVISDSDCMFCPAIMESIPPDLELKSASRMTLPFAASVMGPLWMTWRSAPLATEMLPPA